GDLQQSRRGIAARRFDTSDGHVDVELESLLEQRVGAGGGSRVRTPVLVVALDLFWDGRILRVQLLDVDQGGSACTRKACRDRTHAGTPLLMGNQADGRFDPDERLSCARRILSG